MYKVTENRAECLYYKVQHNMIMNTEMHWLRQNLDQTLNPYKRHIPRPLGRTMVCLLWLFWKQIDRILIAPHCILQIWQLISAIKYLGKFEETLKAYRKKHVFRAKWPITCQYVFLYRQYIGARTKKVPYCIRHFWFAVSWWKMLYFNWNFPWYNTYVWYMYILI